MANSHFRMFTLGFSRLGHFCAWAVVWVRIFLHNFDCPNLELHSNFPCCHDSSPVLREPVSFRPPTSTVFGGKPRGQIKVEIAGFGRLGKTEVFGWGRGFWFRGLWLFLDIYGRVGKLSDSRQSASAEGFPDPQPLRSFLEHLESLRMPFCPKHLSFVSLTAWLSVVF